MADTKAEREFGLDDAALAIHPTVYGPEAYRGKIVLISGGAGGIGRATAWLMGRCGAKVILAGRNEAKLNAAVEAMTAKGLDVSGQVVDIREPDSVAALYAGIAERGVAPGAIG